MKKIRNSFRYQTILIVIISILFSANGFCEHKQSKELSKYLKKLEEEVIEQTAGAEDTLYRSGAVYEIENASQLMAYLNKVAAKIIPPDFNDDKVKIRIKIIRDPTVNAFALPNGTIYVHTGLLARLENEAQLAFVLGHEISHIVNKDGVYATQSFHNKTVSTKLFDIVLAPAAVFFGLLGDLVRSGFGLLYVTSVTGYSKEQEARADRESIKFAAMAGYHPQEAPKIIEIFMKEHEKYSGKEEVYFLMNHPSNQWRKKKMETLIAAEYPDDAGMVKKELFFDKVVDIKIYNAGLNIKMDRLEHAMDDIRSVLDVLPDNPGAHFYSAEIYRIEAKDRMKLKYELSAKAWNAMNKNVDKDAQIDNWRKMALGEYNCALSKMPDYCEVYRGMGILYGDMNMKEEALQNLNKYLELNTDAKDKRYVAGLIKKIESGIPAKKR